MFSINIPVFGFLHKIKCSWLVAFYFSVRYTVGSASKLTSNLFRGTNLQIFSLLSPGCISGNAQRLRFCTVPVLTLTLVSQLHPWHWSSLGLKCFPIKLSVLNKNPSHSLRTESQGIKLKLSWGWSKHLCECLTDIQITWSLQTSVSSCTGTPATTSKGCFENRQHSYLAWSGTYSKFYHTQRNHGFPF